MSKISHNRAYHEYLLSDLWQAKRCACLARARYICQMCLNAAATEVHHLNYVRIFNERADDIIAVCWRCHRKMHGKLPTAVNDNERQLEFSFTGPRTESG